MWARVCGRGRVSVGEGVWASECGRGEGVRVWARGGCLSVGEGVRVCGRGCESVTGRCGRGCVSLGEVY